MLEIYIILSVVFVLWLWIKPRHTLPPLYPGALPLFGHICQVPTNLREFWNKEKEVYEFAIKNDGVVLVKLFSHHCYVIADPDDALLVANTCSAKSYLYRFAQDMYDTGLISATLSTWKPHRKLLNPAFHQQVLNSFLDVFNDQARALVTELAAEVGKDVIDFEMLMMYYSIKTAFQTTLGLNTDEDNLMVEKYILATNQILENYLERAIKFWLHLPFMFNLSSLKKSEIALIKTLKSISSEVIRRKLESKKITKNCVGDATISDQFQPLLDQMFYLADTQGAFTVDEIQDHVNTTIAAAYDTTAKSILFLLILIGSHEDVQSRIIQELNEVFEGEDRNVNKYDLQKLVYLEAVIKETLRLYPTGPRIARYVESDVKMRHYTLLAGSTCIVSIYGINRHPMWGADANQFRPERWLDPASLPENPNAFATFSIGKRNCIGKTYAMMMLKTTLVHVLRNYHITSTLHNLQTRCDIVQSPVKGHEIKIQHRNNS